MNWIFIRSIEELDGLMKHSAESDDLILIYKHSTRCSISSMALRRLEAEWDSNLGELKTYFIDVIADREVSNKLANLVNVRHESPQVLLIQNAEAKHTTSHMAITANWVKDHVN